MYLKIVLSTLLLTSQLSALEKVSLQLKWHHQFQFAGYYAAVEKGYYHDEGLEVTLKDRNPKINNIDQVVEGDSEYGIADSVLLVYLAQKKPVVIVAPIFQHSPNVLITLKSSGIDSPYKMIGKKIAMYPNDADGLPFLAMLHETGVTKKGFERLETNFNIDELTSKVVDVHHGYATNEPFLLHKKGYEVNVIYPQNFGVDLYGDMLFTTQNELMNHPKRVEAMKRATIKGWEYAITHKEEMIRLIQTKYSSTQTADKLMFEANGIIAAIASESAAIGTLNEGRLNYMQKMLEDHGLIKPDESLGQSLYRDARGIRQKILEWVSLDLIVYISFFIFILLIMMAYFVRKLQIKKKELIVLKEYAEASAHSKSEFLATMSHEIRTPMNGVLGMLGLLEKSKLDPTQKHQIHLAMSSATSLLGLINDILDFSKIEAGKMDLEMLEFDLKQELEDFVQSVAFKAEEKGLQLILNTDEISYPNIITDPGRLRQILTNLVGNAIKFTKRGQIYITVSLHKENDNQGHLRIDVIDTGIGISPEKIVTLFEAFTQADSSTTRKYGGSGLGLSIVNKLCDLMGGTINAASVLGKGSTFSVNLTLTLGSDRLLPQKIQQVLKGIQEENIEWPANTRILLVEDNATNQLVANGMLETLGLYADVAANGLEAIEAIRISSDTQPYSIVLMDCQMPEMDGYDATRAIREGKAGEENKNIPIVAMTANAMQGDREKCTDAGMDDYIAKPINLSVLQSALIKWILKEESPQPSNSLQSPVKQIVSTDLSLWDEADALKRLGNNGTLLNKIIESFISDGPKSLLALANALKENNSADAQLHAHSLKGSAGNVSALKLYTISKDLEEAAKNDNLAEVKEGFGQCEQIFNDTLDVFQTHLSKETKPVARKKRLDPLQMAIKLQNLKKELANGMPIDTDAVGIFLEYTDEPFTQKMAKLKEHIERLETDKGIALIDTIMSELDSF